VKLNIIQLLKKNIQVKGKGEGGPIYLEEREGGCLLKAVLFRMENNIIIIIPNNEN
jgi:hypothetical protein